MNNKTLGIIVIILTILDSILTVYGVSNGGGEGHPVLAWVSSHIGILFTMIIYTLVVSLAIIFLLQMNKNGEFIKLTKMVSLSEAYY